MNLESDLTTISTTSSTAAMPVAPTGSTPLQPLPITAVQLDAGFWGDRQRVNAEATLGHCLGWLERSGWLPNFDTIASGSDAEHAGKEFADSEIYKLLEAIAWQLGRQPDETLRGRFDAVVARVGAAQHPDGYLNTLFDRPGGRDRWSDLEWGHELYNLGHLMQAAVATHRSGLGPELVRIACRAADLVCSEFGPDGRQGVCGHAEIELGLVELGRAVGEQRYVDQAALFIDRRGHQVLADIEFGRTYFQDDLPIRESKVLSGHAVRALYLGASAVDVAVDTGDRVLLDAVHRQWRNAVARRTYLTGGMGSRHTDEAFGDDFVLPPDRSYCESCASVASIMLSWRLLLATGDIGCADLIERTLFNVVATAVADDGRSFFYSNTLHRRSPTVPADPDQLVPRVDNGSRAPWRAVSCCPTNLSRTFASLGGYLATTGDPDGSGVPGLQLHQYAAGTITTALAGGTVGLAVHTDYPRSGEIEIEVLEAPLEPWRLSLRVPAWAAGARLTIDGSGTDAAESGQEVQPGLVSVADSLAAGARVRLTLPVAARFTHPDQRIDAIRGTVAVERGPEVLCLESVDLASGEHVDNVVIDPTRPPVEVDGRVGVQGRLVLADDRDWPYGADTVINSSPSGEPELIMLTPYHSWAERGPTTMRVWLRTESSTD